VLPSVKVPVAVNCCVVPGGSVGIAGVTAMDTNAAGVTVTVVEPLICPDLAVILVLPKAAPLAIPWAFTGAVPEFPLVQVADAVKSNVLPSVYVPVAMSCCVVPRAKDGFTGVTAIETKVGAVTFRVVEPLMPPLLAVTVVVPTATLATAPCAFTVATPELAVVQFALAVMF